MAIVTFGIDLAKNVFALRGVGPTGKRELVRPEVRRSRLLEVVASLPPCLIGMEACSGAHHWARAFQKLDHTVQLDGAQVRSAVQDVGQTWEERYLMTLRRSARP